MQTAPCTPNSEKTAFLGYNSEDFSIKSQSGSIDKTKPQISLSEGMALIVCREWNSEGLCHPWGLAGGAGQAGSRVGAGWHLVLLPVHPGSALPAERPARASRSQVAQLQASRTHRSWQAFPQNSKQDVWSLPWPVSSSTDLKQLLLPGWPVPCSCFTLNLLKDLN